MMLQDSGERTQFESGAMRDPGGEDKPRLELISPFFLKRLGVHLANGAKKYTDRNWEKGIPMDRCVAGALRHLNQYRAGEDDEDHLVAAAFGVMCLIHFEEMILRGILPESLNDLPRYTGDGNQTPEVG